MSTIEELKNLQYVPAGSLTDSAPPVSETVLYWEAGEQITASKLNQIDYGVSSATQAINDLATYLDNEITTRSSEDTRVAQQEATARSADIIVEATARQTFDEAIQDSLDAEIESKQRGLVNYGWTEDFENQFLSRSGLRVTWNYEFASTGTTYKFIPNGTAYAGTASSVTTHPGMVLADGHRYRLKARHISGTATNSVLVLWSAAPSTSRISGTSTVEDGDVAYSELTYNAASYPNGVFPILYASRSGGNTLTDYVVELTIEDVTDGIVSNVSGSAVTITAESNHRYLCGTLDSLSFTPSAEGLCEVEFTSGTTATTLQINGVTWPSWFDPNHLSTSTIYDIMIKDGHLGAVMVWPA